MSSLLFVTSSILGQNSKSRELADELVAKWRSAHPGAQVVTRELTVDNAPHLSLETIGALGKPTQDRTTDEQRQHHVQPEWERQVERAERAQ